MEYSSAGAANTRLCQQKGTRAQLNEPKPKMLGPQKASFHISDSQSSVIGSARSLCDSSKNMRINIILLENTGSNTEEFRVPFSSTGY